MSKTRKDIAKTRYYWILSSLSKIVPTDEENTLIAGNFNLLSLADCYALSVAYLNNGILLTTDSGLKETKEVPVKYFKV